MSKNKNHLPYFKTITKPEEKELAHFLLKKFSPTIRKTMSQGCFSKTIPYKTLAFIKKHSKTHPYFLKFDIHLYYPSIDHQLLLQKMSQSYTKLTKRKTSKRFKTYLENQIPRFLDTSPYRKGLPLGSNLSRILAEIFLLDLDLDIPTPFLRKVDDYLLFCKEKNDPEKILKEILSPKLEELNLHINEKKLQSGRFNQDPLDFVGFNLYAGYVTISRNKVELFKKKIKKITHLTRQKDPLAIITLLNNYIVGFGHYYKVTSCSKEFKKLDSFIRMRLRRYIGRNKNTKDKQVNLLLTNRSLKNIGLKSLLEIKEKYVSKKRHIIQKQDKKKVKVSNNNSILSLELSERTHIYWQRSISTELKLLTKNVKQLHKKIAQIEKKLDKKNK